MYAKAFGDVAYVIGFIGHECGGHGDVFAREFFGSSTHSASGSGGRQPCLGALTNEVAFKLSQRGKQVKHEFASGGLGVNLFGEAFKPNAARLQGVDGLDQACEVAPEAVEPPYDEGVACAQGFEAVVEFWAVGVFAAGVFLVEGVYAVGV